MSGESLLRDRVRAWRPASLLVIADEAPWADDCLGGNPETPCVRLPLREAASRLPALGRFDVAVVAGIFETLPRPEASAMIARLRDLHAERLLLVLAREAKDRCWSPNEMLAFGLEQAHEDEEAVVYQFEIARYKLTPDWLNPRDWAHPERFDKFRW